MKTMYSNGSVELPQFPANSSFHMEVKLCQFHVTGKAVALSPSMLLLLLVPLLLRLLLYQAARRQSAPFTFPRLFFLSLSTPFLVQQSPSSGSDCGSKTPCRFCLKNGMGGEAEKGEFSKDPWTALETFTC